MTYLWIYLGGLVVAWWVVNYYIDKHDRKDLGTFWRAMFTVFWPLMLIGFILGAGWRK